MTMEQKLSTDDIYKRARWFGWAALVANSALLLWNLSRMNWSHVVLNSMGLFFVWWTFWIIGVQCRLRPPLTSVKKLCDATDQLLANMYDDGSYENPETAKERGDVSAVEKALADVRREVL